MGTSVRKRAQEALHASEERFRNLVETTSDWVWEVDENCTYTYASPRVRHILGHEPDDVVGKKPFDLMPPEEAARVAAAFGIIVEQREPFSALENINLHKDGHVVVLETSGVPIFDSHGEFRGYHGIDRDVTERKRLEERLNESQKLEAVGRLAGGVAHDFNNLLTVITGNCELVLSSMAKDDPLLQEVQEIKDAANRAALLTGELLAFSRKQMLRPKMLDLNAVVSNLVPTLRGLLGDRIELITVLDADLGAVKADSGQIEHAMVNLALNARDAMPHGGTITIATRNVEVDEAVPKYENAPPSGKHVLLSVADSGPGMDANTRSHIFEPFFTTKKVGKGRGLGLATVHGIVEQSGGHIRVSSEPGRGSTFSIYLPRVEEKPVRDKRTILLVDDDGAVRKLANRALSRQGYEVLQAPGGEEALEIARQHQGQIHLLVTDVVMPHISGSQLAQQLTCMRRGLKVLFVSGYTGDALGQQGVLDDSTNFLQKPFTPDGLASKVRELLCE